MNERLQKIIARAGLASRRHAEEMIQQGRVQVDGVVVTRLGSLADSDQQDIRVDGRCLNQEKSRRYLVLNKPVGYITTRRDPSRRHTVMELLPKRYQSMFPVGRLDMASSGLLLLTDDGDFAQKLCHPRHGVAKTYLVTVQGAPEKRVFECAVRGIRVNGDRLHVDSISVTHNRRGNSGRAVASKRARTRLRIVLRQGRNREIRRLLLALGHPVIELHRERVGGLSDRTLFPGAFRELTGIEVERLLQAVQGSKPFNRRSRRLRGATSSGQGV